MGFYEKLEDLRKTKTNMGQGKLEKELGIANGSISKWKDRSPRPATIEKIANYFNVPITYFFDDNIADESNTDLLVDVLGDNELLEYVRKLQSLNDEHKEKIYHDIDYWHAIEKHN